MIIVVEGQHVEKLTEAVLSVAHELRLGREQREKECIILRSIEALSHKLDRLGETMSSAIQDFAAKQNAFNDRMDAAVTGLQGDIQTLNDKITELQNSAGAITPEDQKLLDDIQARSQAVADKLDALDALTPPTPPAQG